MKIKTLILASSIMITPLISQISQANNHRTGHHAGIAKNAHTPKRGSSMKHVLARFGKAKRVNRSRGKTTAKKPRITRWEYGKFTVYFERHRVLHTVVHSRKI